MSLLDNGPHTVTVYPEETYTDSYGNVARRPSQTGVEVRCVMSPHSNTRDSMQAGTVDTTYKLIARTAPIGNASRVTWNSMNFTVDSVQFFDHSPETSHVEALLRLVEACIGRAELAGVSAAARVAERRHFKGWAPTPLSVYLDRTVIPARAACHC
jgi:hypothetical protein